MSEQVQLLPLAKLKVHPLNPRRELGDLADLAQSIRESGVLEPIIAARNGEGWWIVAGSRRVAAAKAAGKAEVPAIVRDMTDAEIAAAAAIENLQRADLTPIEEAEAYRTILASTPGLTQEQLGQRIGRAQSTIANALRLLKAPAFVRDALRGKTLTPAHARVLLQVKDPAQYDELAQELGKRAEKVTVDDLQELVQTSNDEYGMKGPGAIVAAKAFLAEARAKHPKATITWKSTSEAWMDVLDLADALGEPVKIAGRLQTGKRNLERDTWPTLAQHAKHCDCEAYQIVAERDYPAGTGDQGRLTFDLLRVCVVSKSYREAKPAAPKRPVYRSTSSSAAAKSPRELTPAELAKRQAAERKRAEAKVVKEFADAAKPNEAKYAPIFTRLRKLQMPADVARALAYVGTCAIVEGNLYGLEARLAWERIAKMPAKKVSALASNVLASGLADALLNDQRDPDEASASIPLLAHFGVKVAGPKARKLKRAAKR